MKRIGLTGGIGSGKSTVARIFETLGIPVYYADEAARRMMNQDAELVSILKNEYGEGIYRDGELDRKQLASLVFHDPVKLERLNALVHPATIRDAEQWMKRQRSPYAVKEAALLFESGASEHLDQIIGVYAPRPLRIKRVMDRDGLSYEQVLDRMARQIDEEIKMKLCDHVLVNDEQELIVPQVMALHEKLMKDTR